MRTLFALLLFISSLLQLVAGILPNRPAGTSSSSLASPCGSDGGWRHWPDAGDGGGRCVKLFPAKSGWNVAESNCLQQGGHHISVRDVRENRFLADLASQADGNMVWLGAAQFGQSRHYVWVDGTPFGAFDQWPNNVQPAFHRGRKCLKLEGGTGQWVQSCCRVPAASICQKPVPFSRLPDQIQEDLSTLTKEEREQFRQ